MLKNYIVKQLIFSYSLLFLLIIKANAQTQPGMIHGKILDQNKNALPGATIIIVVTKYGVSSNEVCEYLFDKMPAGKLIAQVSFVGFKTLLTDYDVQPAEIL